MKSDILKILYQKKGEYISGEYIASALNISRVMVKKHIDTLTGRGYDIDAVKKKGYCLQKTDDIFDKTSLNMFLKLNGIYCDVFFYDKTDSTNTQAKKLAQVYKEGVVAAAAQTEGKGRMGRGFASNEGGVYISYFYHPKNITPFDAVKTVIASASAALMTAAKYCNCKIKWANDILCKDKKICGILSEMLTESERVEHIIQAAGFNIYNDLSGLWDTADNIYNLTGKKIIRAEFAADFIKNLKICNGMLENDYPSLQQYYKQNCCTLGKEVTAYGAKEIIKGLAIDIDDNGFLLINTGSCIRTITYGDVSVKI